MKCCSQKMIRSRIPRSGKSYVVVPDANYTLLSTDDILNFKNITVRRNLVLPATSTPGRTLTIITGQNSSEVDFTGASVVNGDGVATTSMGGSTGIPTIQLVSTGISWYVTAIALPF